MVVKKNCYCVFSISMFGKEAVCLDSLFVPAIFQESDFYLNSLICVCFRSMFSVQNEICFHSKKLCPILRLTKLIIYAPVIIRHLSIGITTCRKPPRYVPYKGTYIPYDGTFGTPDQGQTLDV